MQTDQSSAGHREKKGKISAEQGTAGEAVDYPTHEAARRYFGKFERITGYLHDLAVSHLKDDANSRFAKQEVVCIERYVQALSRTFGALSTKYLMTGMVTERAQPQLEIDRTDSGFPVFREILQMASDFSQARHHLGDLPPEAEIKNEIIDHVLKECTIPRRLQFALSQRIYYDALVENELFLAQNDPTIVMHGSFGPHPRKYLVHWATYDSERNLPNLYFMQMEDTGERALHVDDERWPLVQKHLMAQSLSTLKLVTIASGVDKDFADVHPKYLKRIHVGPMYSNTFTRQRGEVKDLLVESAGEPGQDWLLAWTTETLVSKETRSVPYGLFGSVSQEIFDLDPSDAASIDAGVSEIERSIILPYRPYQALLAGRAPSLKKYKRYVIGPDDRILSGA